MELFFGKENLGKESFAKWFSIAAFGAVDGGSNPPGAIYYNPTKTHRMNKNFLQIN